MAKPSPPTISFLLISLLVFTPPPPTEALLYYTQLNTFISLSHSLFSRVADLRASRGDLEGAHRARLIATKLEHGLSFKLFPSMLSFSREYLMNSSWRDAMSFQDAFDVISDLNELLSPLTEFTRLNSDYQRAKWIFLNHKNVLRVSKSVFYRLLSLLRKSGALGELMEIMQKEMEGELLKDYLEVGTNDFKGLIQIIKDFTSQLAI